MHYPKDLWARDHVDTQHSAELNPRKGPGEQLPCQWPGEIATVDDRNDSAGWLAQR